MVNLKATPLSEGNLSKLALPHKTGQFQIWSEYAHRYIPVLVLATENALKEGASAPSKGALKAISAGGYVAHLGDRDAS